MCYAIIKILYKNKDKQYTEVETDQELQKSLDDIMSRTEAIKISWFTHVSTKESVREWKEINNEKGDEVTILALPQEAAQDPSRSGPSEGKSLPI